MSYVDSTHLSNKIPYETLFISNYGLKDMNYARFKDLQEFLEKLKKWWDFSLRKGTRPAGC
jgi:hypothetical protein